MREYVVAIVMVLLAWQGAHAEGLRSTREFGCMNDGRAVRFLADRVKVLSPRQLKKLRLDAQLQLRRSKSPRKRGQLLRQIRILKELPLRCRLVRDGAISTVVEAPSTTPDPLYSKPTISPTAIPSATPEQPTVYLRTYSCFDGEDNNGDGVSDLADFGCFGPNQSELISTVERGVRDSEGYTVFHPSSDTQILYVSSSGNDSPTCGASPASPCQTLRTAHDRMRARQAAGGRPDWILLKRGDEWRNQMLGDEYGAFTLSGRSAEEPLLIGSYGASALRPRIVSTNGGGIMLTLGTPVNHVAVVGLEFMQTERDWYEGGTALRLLAASTGMLLEDLKISGFGGAMALEAYAGPVRDFTLRRSVIHDQWSNLGHAQGVYVRGVDGVTLEENIWVRNGWRPGAVVVPLTNGRWNPSNSTLTQDGAAWVGPGTRYPTVTAGDTIEIVEGHLVSSAVTSGTGQNTVYEFNGGASLSNQTGYYINRLVKMIQGAGSPQYKRIVSYDGATKRIRVDGGFDQVPNAGQSFEIHMAALATVEEILSPNTLRLSVGALGSEPLTTVKSGEGFRPTIYNRSIYISGGEGNTRLIGNIDVLGASGGMQVRRGCADCSRNVLIESPAGISIGHAANARGSVSSGVVRQNLLLGARDVNQDHPLGWGLTITGHTERRTIAGVETRECASYVTDALIHDNIIAHNRSATGNLRALYTGPCVIDTQFSENIVYDWSTLSGAGAAVAPDYSSIGVRNVAFVSNDLQQPRGGRSIAIDQMPLQLQEAFLFHGNRHYSGGGFPIFAFNEPRSFMSWVTLSQFGSDSEAAVEYPDPTRDLQRYMEVLGLSGGLDGYVDHLLSQSKIAWDDRFTADALNNFVRTGFGKGLVR